MTAFRLSTGQEISLGQKLAEGGQGVVYDVQGHEGLLAKLFHSPADTALQRKLIALIRSRTPDLERAAAWPTDIVLNRSGTCVGLVMPKIVRAHEIDRLAHPAEQRHNFPTIDYGFLLHVGMNVARAVSAIHATGCIIGDLNERNVLVLPDGKVRFIDVDSFQVEWQGELFPCPVGSDLYTAPELRGRTFARERRTVNHDAFGLAVLLFQLLMFGRHPFAGVPKDGRPRTIEESIRDGLYAYSRNAAARVSPPPSTIDIRSLGSLSQYFERAFTTNARPKASEWMNAFDRERSRLRRCAQNPRHVILNGVSSCYICVLPHDPLPKGVAAPASTDLGGISIGELIARAGRLHAPKPLTERYLESNIPIHARHVRHNPRGDVVKNWGVGIGGVSLAMAALAPLSGEFRIGVLGVGMTFAIVTYAIGKEMRDSVMAQLIEKKEAASNSLAALESIERQASIEVDAYNSTERSLRTRIEQARFNLSNADTRLRKVLSEADRSWKKHRLADHLSRSLIRQSSIPGIGPSRSAVLASFGIETAADVEYRAVRRVPGFGPKFTDRLIAWKRQRESEFWASGPGRAPVDWINQLRQDHHQEVSAKALELRRDLQEYERQSQHYESRFQVLAPAVDSARSKARADLNALHG